MVRFDSLNGVVIVENHLFTSVFWSSFGDDHIFGGFASGVGSFELAAGD